MDRSHTNELVHGLAMEALRAGRGDGGAQAGGVEVRFLRDTTGAAGRNYCGICYASRGATQCGTARSGRWERAPRQPDKRRVGRPPRAVGHHGNEGGAGRTTGALGVAAGRLRARVRGAPMAGPRGGAEQAHIMHGYTPGGRAAPVGEGGQGGGGGARRVWRIQPQKGSGGRRLPLGYCPPRHLAPRGCRGTSALPQQPGQSTRTPAARQKEAGRDMHRAKGRAGAAGGHHTLLEARGGMGHRSGPRHDAARQERQVRHRAPRPSLRHTSPSLLAHLPPEVAQQEANGTRRPRPTPPPSPTLRGAR